MQEQFPLSPAGKTSLVYPIFSSTTINSIKSKEKNTSNKSKADQIFTAEGHEQPKEKIKERHPPEYLYKHFSH